MNMFVLLLHVSNICAGVVVAPSSKPRIKTKPDATSPATRPGWLKDLMVSHLRNIRAGVVVAPSSKPQIKTKPDATSPAARPGWLKDLIVLHLCNVCAGVVVAPSSKPQIRTKPDATTPAGLAERLNCLNMLILLLHVCDMCVGLVVAGRLPNHELKPTPNCQARPGWMKDLIVWTCSFCCYMCVTLKDLIVWTCSFCCYTCVTFAPGLWLRGFPDNAATRGIS